jgi:hypothetical protein
VSRPRGPTGLRAAAGALGHSNLGITSIYLQGIDNAEIIDTVHGRRAPMVPVSASLRLRTRCPRRLSRKEQSNQSSHRKRRWHSFVAGAGHRGSAASFATWCEKQTSRK